ncbi:hypothetical protein R6Q59_007048 [Mikania micrantha]
MKKEDENTPLLKEDENSPSTVATRFLLQKNLAVSNSQQYASPIPFKRAVMSAEPCILTHKSKPQDLFVIFTSYGLWEQLSDEAVVEIVHKNPRNGITNRLTRAAIEVATKKREMRYDDIKKLEKGVRRHFHDDITMVVVYIDYSQGWPNSSGKF